MFLASTKAEKLAALSIVFGLATAANFYGAAHYFSQSQYDQPAGPIISRNSSANYRSFQQINVGDSSASADVRINFKNLLPSENSGMALFLGFFGVVGMCGTALIAGRAIEREVHVREIFANQRRYSSRAAARQVVLSLMSLSIHKRLLFF